MRDSGLVGLTGIPLVIALLVVVPLATRRQATPVGTPTAIDTAFIVADLSVDTVERFRIGRDLLAEVTGAADLESLRVLIALLPDPDESSLDWTYDAHLAALRRALEMVGYLSDRTWFPTRSDSATVTRAGRTVTRPAPDLLPGVMVFRGEAGRSIRNLAIVYTVGEIPTTGVHREALRTALREARALMDTTSGPTDPELDPTARTDTLRILGPTFSGSAPSLRAVLEQERPARCRPVRIMSGSATSPQARAMLDFPLPCGEDEAAGSPVAVAFDATVHTDAEYAALIGTRLLGPLELDAHSVAVLAEANTVYGRGASGPDTLSVDSVAARDTPFIPEALAGEHQATLDSAMVITFPLNIASVRSAYDRNPRTQTDEQLFRRPGSRLPLPLEMERRPREGPPARSRLTAPALDQVLEDILATLRARRIRAVGILATDVRDKLFLAEVVHRELPDVLLFTYEGNALFARRDLIGSVRGMVVASSYPLILQNVEWTGGDDWVPFAVEGAAGVFNAALFLLGRPELVQQYRHPDHPYRRPLGEGARVPLWLTTVGTGQLLPLAVVDVGDDPEVPSAPALPAVDTRTTVDPHPDLHGRPGLFETLSVIFAILQPIWLLLVLSSPRSGEAASGRWVWSASRTRGRRADDQWRSLDSLAVMAALLAFFTPLGTLVGIAPAWAGAGEPLFWLAVALNAELALTIAILGVALVRAILTRAGSETRALRRRRKTLERFGSPVGGSVLAVAMDVSAHALALLLAGLAFGYCVQIVDAFASGPTDYGLYRHRALNLASGVSGLLPLLMTAIAVVFLVGWHRDRRRLLHIGRGRYENREVREGGGTPKEERRRAEGSGAERRQSLDLLPEQLAGGSGPDADVPRALLALVEALVRIRGRLEVRVPGRLLAASVPVALLSLVVLRSAFGTPALGTVETVALPGSIIMWILGLGLAVGFLHVGASLFHLVMVWGAFKRFLEGLADTPLAPAFDRLPKRLRTMGRLHVFDPSSDKPGRVLAEAGHEAVWAEASANFDAYGLEKAGLTEEEAEVHRKELKGTDLDSQRARSLESLIRAVRSSWERGPGHVWRAQADEPKAGSTPAPAEALEPWLRRVEDLLALEGARYVDWVLRNVRRLVLFLFFVMLFTTALLEAMPFPYHAAMTTVFVVLVGVTVLTVIGIMMQLAHDEILSRITGTEPGKLNWHGPSLVNALLFIALPVLGLLGTEVDPVGRTLFGWVQDLLRILSIR